MTVALVAAACLLGILNSGGYQYGASDQAFYLPAVIQHLDTSLFPRDRELLHAQDRFMLFDDLAGGLAKATGVSLPVLFLVLFLAGLGVLFAASTALGRLWYRSWWSVVALTLVLTLRHRITRTGVNTLEGYLHPRVLAFGVGVWAVVAFLRGRPALAVGLVAAAAALHPTTALWFALWLGTAIAAAEPRWRKPLAAAAAAGVVIGMWLLWFGPLRGHLERIDAAWLAVLATKDYLFVTDWPISAWLINLSYVVVIAIGYRLRAARHLTHPRERALVIGALTLSAVFLASVPLVMMRLALAVQLQVPRVFWMLEWTAALYLIWMAMELHGRESSRASVRTWVTVVVALATLARGAYIMTVEHPERQVVGMTPRESPWTDAMAWLRQTPVDTHVLADPNHAFSYGSSARVLGERDLFLDASKDTALAIYARPAAARVLERIQALGDFSTLTPEAARNLAGRYDLDVLVTERTMNLPLVYTNEMFNVYELRPSVSPAPPVGGANER